MILKPFIADLRRPQSIFAIIALTGIFLPASSVLAQQPPEMAATYGRGVHAFFARRTSDAEQMFSEVIAAGSADPRAYYFRAIARMRLERTHEAEDDMRIGAAYEARTPGIQHMIDQALQRVQGPARRTLERFRREGRLGNAQLRRHQSQQRYEQLRQRNPIVLRSEDPVQLHQLLDPTSQSMAPSTVLEMESVPQPTVPGGNAVEEAATGDTLPADDDLFGDPAPLEETPAEEIEEESDDLFGEPFGEDPFGETAPAEEDPAEEVSEEFDDLFGSAAPDEDSVEEPMTLEETLDHSTSTPSTLATSDKVESSKLVGILQRVVASSIPWRGIRIPNLGPQDVQAVTDSPSSDFELGPSNDGRATPASAEQPLENSHEDLLGSRDLDADFSNDSLGSFSDLDDAADDDAADDEEPSIEGAMEPSSDDDDPFGDF